MAIFIQGIAVTLYEPTQTGVDAFNRPVVELVPTVVENVLVQPQEQNIDPPLNSTDLDAASVTYLLGIPKGDTHVWENREVEFFGQRFRTEGFAREGIDAMIPLEWNRKIICRRFS